MSAPITAGQTRASGRVGGWIGLIVCVIASLTIAALSPDPATDVRRAYVDVTVGSPASTPATTAEVTSVRVAHAVQESYGDAFVSRQRLVVVNVEVAVRQRPRTFNSSVTLRTPSGDDYTPRDEFVTADLGETQPGFTRASTLVFEVPTDRVAGDRLVIDADSASFDVYATALRVDLGLSAQTQVATKPIAIKDSTVMVTP